MQQDLPQQQKPVTNPTGNILKTFGEADKKKTVYLALASVGIVVLGVALGWVISGGATPKGKSMAQEEGVVRTSDMEAGLADESAFPDSVEGTLKEGGVKGEGTHHLEREGGVSQNVYLTSTVIDLQSFVDRKVKIWGETISGVHAGWLMDVGKIKVIE